MSAKNTPVKTPDKKKLIIIGVVCVILLLNIMWTILQGKFTPKLEEVQTQLAALEQRIAKLEQGGMPDVADLKNDFEALKEVSAKFSERFNQSVKAEEDQLSYLEAQVEAQKARVAELKKIAGTEEANPAE